MLNELFLTSIISFFLAFVLPLVFFKYSKSKIRQVSLSLSLIGAISALAISSMILLNNVAFSIILYTLIPQLSVSILIDRLAAFFILIISIIALSAIIYSFQYIEHGNHERRKNLLASLTGLFILSMILVVSSKNTFSFLIFWELMSVSSFLLIMYEYEKPETKKAGIFYFIMTQLSTVFLIFAFVLMYILSGSFDIVPLNSIPVIFSTLIFISLFIGFGIKAGVIPFHKWLPYAHSAVPSNISALMSGVMIKVAIYGMIRFIIFSLEPKIWWGVLILLAGTISAFLGVIYALKEHDIKRLLAYHSIENIGIILIGIGLFIIFDIYSLPALALLSLAAALFHTLNHALFKSLLFLTAGNVVNATGERNIEDMGGLIKNMPYTATLFLIGAISISALPPFNGFVSELMIFQVFFAGAQLPNPYIQIILFISLSIFALTSALAAACFVKAFGITFLAQPRSINSKKAKEAPSLMIIGPSILAVLCIILGVFSKRIFSLLGYDFPIPDLEVMVLITVVIAVFVILFLRYFSSKKTRVAETWGCGIISQTPKMEYTASGFSEPIVTIFKSIYRTKKHSEKKYYDSQNAVFKSGFAEIHLMKFFEEALYMPVANLIRYISRHISRVQNFIESDIYIFYIFITALGLLVFIGWFM